MGKPVEDKHWRKLSEISWFGLAPFKVGYLSLPSMQGLPAQEIELWLPECDFTACQFLVRFIDPAIRGEDRFLGLAVIAANSWAEAFAITHEKDMNPGGTAAITPIPIDRAVPERYCGRLLSKDEAESMPCDFMGLQ